MCTVSWTRCRGGYDLFFNRDELTTRAPETPPTIDHGEGVAFISPRDGNSGGTWLLANEHGLTVCLLNDYGAIWRPSGSAPRFSRGHVVLACASLVDPTTADEVIGRLPLARTPAFHLVILAPDEEAWVLQWNGTELSGIPQPADSPLRTSSSFETAEVIEARTRRFGSFVQAPNRPEIHELAAYHRQYEADRGSHSVLMRRPDAATRSITHVIVRREGVTMHYEPRRWTLFGPATPEPVATVVLGIEGPV